MTATVTELESLSKSTYWNPSNFATTEEFTGLDDDSSLTELYELLKSKLAIGAATGLTLLALSQPSINTFSVSLQAKRPIVLKGLSSEGLINNLTPTVSDSVQSFFQRAKNRLISETEITAQKAAKLLERIEVLLVAIQPQKLHGIVHAFVDSEDNSTTIEWIHNRNRLGFVIDRENESSWFIVLSNGFSDAGYLYRGEGLKSLHKLLEMFVNAH